MVDYSMAIKMILAFLLAFGISAGFGKFFVPWLKKHSFSQPLKDEVAQIYIENELEKNEGQHSGKD